MAVAVMLGFMSHLLLDEICSVDLRGARVNKAFGTAIKFWAPNPWTTLAIYLLLSYLSWRVIEQWPENSSLLTARIPAPQMPFSLPRTPPPTAPDAGHRLGLGTVRCSSRAAKAVGSDNRLLAGRMSAA